MKVSEAGSRRVANDLTAEVDENTATTVEVLEFQSRQR